MLLRRQLAMVVAVAAGCAAGCGGADGDDAESAETRALMGELYRSIRVVLPASVGEAPFSDADRREEVTTAITLLADNADLLERHASDDDEQTRFLSRSVARDARELQRAHAHGNMPRAGFLAQQITENCIACHSRLPDREDPPLAAGFLDDDALAALTLEERAALQMATRRFDDALATLEQRIAQYDHPALMIGPLTDYLVVALRVKGDYERPIPVLRRFAARDDLWTTLRLDVESWIESLPRMARLAQGEPDLGVARELVREARGLDPFPGSHRSVVQFVTASAILERFVDQHRVRDALTAEAYYLRAVTEAWIGRNYWVTPAPFLLETAIRIAPREPFAERAFALLERETLAGYEGADEEIPAVDRRRLDELRALITAPPR